MIDETKNSTTELIKRLSLATGVTGYTGPNNIHDAVTVELTPYVDRVERDRLGSVVGIKFGDPSIHTADSNTANRNRKIMLAAHLDEIGAIVTKVDKGFLRFTEIGGLDDRILMGQEVTVHSRRDLPGIIGSVPPHLLSKDRSNSTVFQRELHIDVGLPRQQVERLVQAGDLV